MNSGSREGWEATTRQYQIETGFHGWHQHERPKRKSLTIGDPENSGFNKMQLVKACQTETTSSVGAILTLTSESIPVQSV